MCVCVCVTIFIYGQSCLDLKNYEAATAVVSGLTEDNVQKAVGAWQVYEKSLVCFVKVAITGIILHLRC